MRIRRRVNGGEWEELDVDFGVLEDDWDALDGDDEGGIEPLMCMYCSSPASSGQYTCGRASCVGRDIEREVARDGEANQSS